MEGILKLKRRVKKQQTLINILEQLIDNNSVGQGSGSPEGVYDGLIWYDAINEIMYINRTPGFASGGWVSV